MKKALVVYLIFHKLIFFETSIIFLESTIKLITEIFDDNQSNDNDNDKSNDNPYHDDTSVFFNVFPKKTLTLMLLRRHYFQVKTDIRETGIKEILDKMYNEEFAEVSFTGSKKKRKMSQQDMRFMKILDAETKLKDGHYQIPLPF